MAAQTCQPEDHHLVRFHRQHPWRQLVGEFVHFGYQHPRMLLEQEPVLEQFPACYSRKPLPMRSHKVLVLLTMSSYGQSILRDEDGLWLY